MSPSRLTPRRRAVAAAVAVIVVGAGAVAFAALGHDGKDNGAKQPSLDTAPGQTTAPGGGSGPISGLSADQIGISTGVVLFTGPTNEIDSEIAGMAKDGAKWIRTAVRWDLVEPDSPSTDDWAVADAIVEQSRANKLKIVLDINGTPAWARNAGAAIPEFPRDLQTYATFAGKLAARYKGKVEAYELGNEPNHVKTFAHPDAALYAQVLKLSYPVIKAADPDALVLTGGLGGNRDKNGNIPGDVFLEGLYKAGAKGFFDAVSYHPYTYPLLPSEDKGDRGWSRMLAARQAMVDNGDGDKQIWVTEFGAPTGGRNGVSQQQQAAIMRDGLRLWAGYSWAGPFCWFQYRDKGTDTSEQGDFFGLYANDGQPKLALAQFRSLAPSAN